MLDNPSEQDLEDLKYYQEQRKKRKRSFWRLPSPLLWIVDDEPYDSAVYPRRSIDEAYLRTQVRSLFSWHYIARMQNDNVFRFGMFGTVSAPILAGLTHSIQQLIAVPFPASMFYLFFSGLTYVVASTIYRFRVPPFISLYFDRKKNAEYMAASMDNFTAKFYRAILDLARAERLRRGDIWAIDHPMDKETARHFIANGMHALKLDSAPLDS